MTTETSERSAPTSSRQPRTLGYFAERLARYLALAMVFVGLGYYLSTKGDMDPTLIRLWLVVWISLAVTQIVLDVRNRR